MELAIGLGVPLCCPGNSVALLTLTCGESPQPIRMPGREQFWLLCRGCADMALLAYMGQIGFEWLMLELVPLRAQPILRPLCTLWPKRPLLSFWTLSERSQAQIGAFPEWTMYLGLIQQQLWNLELDDNEYGIPYLVRSQSRSIDRGSRLILPFSCAYPMVRI